MAETYVVTHDVGTTGNKSSIYRITDRIDLVQKNFLVFKKLYEKNKNLFATLNG
jgi:hypothetical protein